MNAYTHLFGPVPSRRYGRSLGVDLAVPKTCTLNCRFCQLGPTPQTTVERTLAPPMDDILAELRRWLATDTQRAEIDFITASGSGEPTLHLRFGDLFRFVRAETASRSLLLTNGSLFHLPDVRRDAALADVVKVSLHAWDQPSFEHVTRPHPALRFDAILDGFRAFRRQFAGRLDLEVFIIPGFNDTDAHAQRIAALAQSFAPDAVTLNTAVRPPADGGLTACPPERLRALAAFFGPAAHAGGAEPPRASGALTADALVALIARHPLSLRALAATFGKTEPDIRACVEPLVRDGRLRLFTSQGEDFVEGKLK
ncbi:MAG: radical SAM protein [Verrucomicrobiota bacterium]|jgi:wyosine [tRNA(Phe)-imidazoG37] synthetase (radical SAM superfamily)|nr:radical SAM protein [Verrucomicrobiota bacterium]